MASMKRLRTLATHQASVEEFLEAVKGLLARDFDETFDHLKTQKLLMKFRSTVSLKKLAADLDAWACSAPLSGKRRTRLRKHLRICERVQGLFCEIDRKAAALTASSADSDCLMLSILGKVELVQEQSNREANEENALFAKRTPWEYINRFNAIRAQPRDYCDAANLLLREVGSRADSQGRTVLAEQEVEKLFAAAFDFDTVEAMFDNYTFHGWKAEVLPDGLRFVPRVDDFSKAKRWASQRVHASDDIENDEVRDELATLIAGDTSEDLDALENSFDAFLSSNLGAQVLSKAQRVSLLVRKRMTSHIEEVFDANSQLKTANGAFSIRDLLKTWSFFLALVFAARFWIKHRHPQGLEVKPQALVPRIPYDFLEKLVVKELDFTTLLARAVLEQFSTRIGQNRGVDLFLRPLLRLRNGQVVLPLTFIDMSRFDRNVFRIAINESRIDLSPRGLRPLAIIADRFRSAGFEVNVNVPVLQNQRLITDVDLVLFKDACLFLGQAKIVVQPDGHYEMWQAGQKLAHAAQQLRKSITALGGARNLSPKQLGLKEGRNPVEVVPFILTNVWDFTGATVENYPIVDLSYLTMLLSGGIISSGTRTHMKSLKLIRGRFPSGQELAKLIGNPVHRAMFSRRNIEHMVHMVGDQKIYVPVTFL